MRISVLLFLCIAVSGCTGYQYVSPPAYVPMNAKRGDLKANLSTTHVQVGYAFKEHLSLFTTGFFRYRETSLNFGSWGTKEGSGANRYNDRGYQIGGGLSYFRGDDDFRYEIQLGGSRGASDYSHEKDVREGYKFNMNAKLTSFILQPSISFKGDPRERSRFALFAKVSTVRYDDLQLSTQFGPTVIPDKQDVYFINKTAGFFTFAEPGINFQAGSRVIKWNTVLSVPILLDNSEIRFRKFNMSMSMLISFNLTND